MKRISQNAAFFITAGLALCLVTLVPVGCTSMFFQKISLQHERSAADQASAAHASTQMDETAKPQLLESYGKRPLSFEANQGQTDPRVKFISRGSGYTLFLTDTEAVLTLKRTGSDTAKANSRAMRDLIPPGERPRPEKAEYTTLRMKLDGANSNSRVFGLAELPGKVNYFSGKDPAQWQTNIPTFARVQYSEVYPGINLTYYGNQSQLEYDLVVQPGADPNQIKLAFEGTDDIHIDTAGDLILQTNGGKVRLLKPEVYQEIDGVKKGVPVRYVLGKKDADHPQAAPEARAVVGSVVGFRLAAYDRARPLIIDPVLSYSTYLGGSGDEFGFGIAVDGLGNAYVTGYTSSADFPTASPLQGTSVGDLDVFVSKLNAAGSALIYSTYLGGTGTDVAYGIAVDGSGNAYVSGMTGSICIDIYQVCFPTTAGAFQTDFGGGASDAFVTKLNASGSALVYSTYLGGSGDEAEWGQSIAVDGAGNAYVIGNTSSTDYPTANPFQSANAGGVSSYGGDLFVSKINAAGSALVYSTYLGGSGDEFGIGIAVDGSDNAYLSGSTGSTDFPTANPLQPVNGGSGDAFVAKFNSTGSALVYSTYLGGSNGDTGDSIAVDALGNAYVTGVTASTDFPTASALQPTNAGLSDGFVAKLDAAGATLVYSTYLGGSGDDHGDAIAVDGLGNAYVAGVTASTDFPTVNPLQAVFGGGPSDGDAFVAKLNATGSALDYSTYLGGSDDEHSGDIAVDSSGNAYVTGRTASTNFPLAGSLQNTHAGGVGSYDAFVSKIGSASAGQSDLTMTVVMPNAPTVNQGGTLSVTDTVKNQGTAPAGTFRIGYHLSTTMIYGNGDDISIPTVRILTTLAAGVSDTATTSLSIPSTAPGGIYFLCAIADSVNQVAESDETNNTQCSGATVLLPSADLVMTAVSTSTTVLAPGQTLSVSDTVLNQGGYGAGSFRIGYYLSVNSDGSTPDVAITATRTLSALAAGVSSSGTTSLTVPSTTPPNSYYLCAMADSLTQVPESDEGNNRRCTSGTLQVALPTLPDLTMTEVTPNAATAHKGGKLLVTTMVSNGGGASGVFRIAFHLSPNDTYGDSDDVVITVTRVVTSLAAGASSTGTTNLTLPGATPSGDYYVCTLADSLDQVTETNEGNNILCSSTTVHVP